ncbi:choice-of-anchor A family protein, partial [Paenibacillus sp. S150]|uniref:choice-of-anchor A family protein n=1 Tax=Paenibacillus sp. S150 TaxID=2749826 RepID=UPI001C55A3CE
MKKKTLKTAAIILTGALTLGSSIAWGWNVKAAANMPYTSTPVLGVAGNFNAFIFGDFTQSYDQIHGRLAAAGNITLQGYGVSQDAPGGDVLVAGKNISLTDGTVYGAAVYGGSINSTRADLKETPRQGTPVDFQAEEQFLIGRSNQLAALAQTQPFVKEYGKITFNAPQAYNIFNLTAADLADVNGMQFNISGDATVTINVSGSSVRIPSFQFWGGKPRKVLFNFYEATSLNIGNTTIEGTILAPHANVFYDYAELHGTLIAKAFNGHVQMHHYPYEGSEPPSVPTPTPGETPAPTPGETPAPTPGETPAPTPGETPAPTPGETPAPTPGETPAPTPGETPAPTPGETPAPTP